MQTSPPARLWAELERDAHRMVLEMLHRRLPTDDVEQIATRVLSARNDVTASMRDELLDSLAATVAKQVELLRSSR